MTRHAGQRRWESPGESRPPVGLPNPVSGGDNADATDSSQEPPPAACPGPVGASGERTGASYRPAYRPAYLEGNAMPTPTARVPRFKIRNMDLDDLPRLAGMASADPNAWGYADLHRAMESNYALGVVATCESQPLGWLVYVVSDATGKAARRQNRLHLTVVLLRMSINPDWRRRGVGRFLLRSVEEALIKQFSQRVPGGRLRTTTTVPESWLSAQLFLKSAGFRVPEKGGIERAPFAFCDEDGYLFERKVEWPVRPSAEAPPAPPSPGKSQTPR